MTYRLRVTARAVADADEAYAWIAEHRSPAQAERWYQGLFKQMETLTRQPTRCPRAAESDKFPKNSANCSTASGTTNTASYLPSATTTSLCSTSITPPVRNWSRKEVREFRGAYTDRPRSGRAGTTTAAGQSTGDFFALWKKEAGAGSSTPRSRGARAARRGVGPRGRMMTHPRRGGSTRDAGQGPAQLSSSQRLRSCRRICSETGQTSPPALPACHPRARSCAATLAADRGPSSLEGPGCPFIRRFIRSLRGPHM